jgi:hypothetical protein
MPIGSVQRTWCASRSRTSPRSRSAPRPRGCTLPRDPSTSWRIGTSSSTRGTSHIITLSYFTNLTNTLIVVMAAALLRGRGRIARVFASAPVQAAFSLYILFVGLAFWFVLGGPEEVEAWWLWIPEVTAHSLSPLLGVVWWVAAVPKGRLRLWHPFAWLAYPVAYLGYWLVRGPIVGEYPYFFIDVDELGYAGVAVWTGILVAGFLVLGLVMWVVDRLRSR